MEIETKIIKVYPLEFRNNNHEDVLASEYIRSVRQCDKETILNNPYLTSEDVVQLIGVWNGKIVGAIKFCFPLKVRAYDKELIVVSGSTLYVDEKYRNESGMGAFLMMEKLKIHPSKNCLSAGISQMALPLYKKLKYAVFETPRLMCIRHCRSVVEHYTHFRGTSLTCISSFVDIFIKLFYKIRFFQAGLARYACREVREVTDDILSIIEADKKPYAELHNKEWWLWVMNHSISTSNSEKHLYEIVKDGVVVGFFLNKIEFHESASSRGFKNVLLGSIIEWGVDSNSELTEYQAQLLAIKNMPSNVDAVELTTTELNVMKKLKHSFMVQVGNTNIAVRLKELQKNTWEDVNLWRIRMAASDVSIN